MFKNLIIKEWKDLQGIFKNKADVLLLVAVLLFILINTLKITAFNFYLMPEQTPDLFIYKFGFTLFVVTIIYPLLFMFRSRIILPIFYGLQTIYILVNTAYYMYFKNFLHINEALSVFKEGFAAVQNAAAPVDPLSLLILIDLPILIWIIRHYSGIPRIVKSARLLVLLAIVISVCGLAQIEKSNFEHKVSYKQSIKNYYEGESDIIARYGTLFNNGVNMYENKDYSFLVNKFEYGEVQSSKGSSKSKPNFVFIQVESMDANVIDQKHDGQYIAPYLHALSNDSVYYPYTMSYHMGGSTSDTEFSVINSIQPLADYPSIKLSNYDYGNSMIEKLKDASYNTLAFHGNVGGFFNRNLAFPKMGFDRFYDINSMGLKEQGWGASDGDVFNYTLETLKKAKKPFFAYAITMTSHGPFTNAANYYENPAFNDIPKKRIRNYYNSMAYVDQSIEEFVAQIHANFKNTYIIIIGDHTPSIDSEKFVQASFEENDRYFEFVPMMIITPDHKVYKETRMAASFLDIAPTILNASRIPYEIKSDGLDLLAFPNQNANIPYENASFDRYSLFAKVPKTNNEADNKLALIKNLLSH